MSYSNLPYLIVLLITVPLIASPRGKNVRDIVLELIPSEIEIPQDDESRESIRKKYSKNVISEEKDAIYLKYFSKQNDVTIGIKNEKIEYMLIKANSKMQNESKLLFKEISKKLSEGEKKEIIKENSGDKHEDGRFININLPNDNLKLTFYNNSEKDLYSIILWPKNKKSK